jgi:guanine deaminase
MLEQMKEAMDAGRIAQPEALYLATLAGAKALGISDRIGSLDPGKDADFVILDQDAIHKVYVRGKLVYP